MYPSALTEQQCGGDEEEKTSPRSALKHVSAEKF